MVFYHCSKCSKEFKNENTYIKHVNKRIPCIDNKNNNVKHNLGQYFTKHIDLKEKVYQFILNDPTIILEPCIGKGDLIDFILDKNKNKNIKFDMYEIDESIELLSSIQKDKVIYTDFITAFINKKYKTIIGNPPYIRTKKGNLYIDFIEKCYHLLDENGELIFIVPSDFFKLTCASQLLNLMMLNGSFTHIYHPNNEKLFENASIDIIIFRYCKNKYLEKTVFYNNVKKNIININGLITFSECFINELNINNEIKNDINNYINNDINNYNEIFQNYFDIYVGLVSGKEQVYKNNEHGNIQVLNGIDKIEKYIYITSYPSGLSNIDNYLLEHKEILMKREIRKFTDKNWYEWGAPRNIKSIEKNMGKDCIYIYNLTRQSKVAFIDKVQYFGGSLIMMIPKKNLKNEDLSKIINYLNSDLFKNNFIFSGRFKIGHRQISNSIIPKDLCF